MTSNKHTKRPSYAESGVSMSSGGLAPSPRPPSVASKLSPRPPSRGISSESLFSSSNASVSGLKVASGSSTDSGYHPFHVDGHGTDKQQQPDRPSTRQQQQTAHRAVSRHRSAAKKITILADVEPAVVVRPDTSFSRRQSTTSKRARHIRSLSTKAKTSRRPMPNLPSDVSLMDLSDELLSVLCTYLPFRQRVRVERVCRRFQKSARASWGRMNELTLTQMFEDQNSDFDQIDQVTSGFLDRVGPLLLSVNLSNSNSELQLEDATISAIGSKCDKLKFLDLSYVELNNAQLSILSKSTAAQSLERLALVESLSANETPDTGLKKLLKHCANLKHLDLAVNSTVTGDCFAALPVTLESLNINKCISVKDENVNQIAKRCSQTLETLCASSTRCDLGAALAQLSNLRQLELNYYEHELSPAVVAEWRQLRHFEMSHTYALGQELVNALGKHCTLLEVLRIAGKEAVIGKIRVKGCDKFSRLRVLDLSWYRHITDADLNSLSKSGQLVEVNLHDCGERLSGPALLRVVRNNMPLRYLTVTGVKAVDEGLIKYMSDETKRQQDKKYPLTVRVAVHVPESVVKTYTHCRFEVDQLRSWKFDLD